MGWTSYHRVPGESDRDHLTRELLRFGLEEGPSKYEFVDTATVATTFYAAVRNRENGEVCGLVVLQQRQRGYHNYFRKEIDETMGPAEDRCPDRILDLLSPTENEYALDWRARCRKYNERRRTRPKVGAGAVVRFASPLRFSDGVETDEFRLVGRSTFVRVLDGRRVRIPSWRERAYTAA